MENLNKLMRRLCAGWAMLNAVVAVVAFVTSHPIIGAVSAVFAGLSTTYWLVLRAMDADSAKYDAEHKRRMESGPFGRR